MQENAFVTQLEVELPSGPKITIFKLKAKKYYDAQKLFLRWIQLIDDIIKFKELDFTKFLGEDGKVDEKKLMKEVATKQIENIDKLLEVSAEATKTHLDFIALCMGLADDSDLQDKFYPEDIEVLSEKVIELNRFTANLKKLGPPTPS